VIARSETAAQKDPHMSLVLWLEIADDRIGVISVGKYGGMPSPE
jgi:hypothetical protein